MRLDYFLYMAEKEGHDELISTRTARINAAIEDFILMAKNGYNINNNDIQATILNDHNISNITTKETNYIAREVEKRIF